MTVSQGPHPSTGALADPTPSPLNDGSSGPMILLNEVVSTLIQLGIALAIPFVVHRFRKERARTFRESIGLIRPEGLAVPLSIVAALGFVLAGVGMAAFDPAFREALLDPATPSGRLNQMGPTPEALGVLVLLAVFRTALAEEILFRGFLGGILVRRLGEHPGNLLQAVIFGLLHLLLVGTLLDLTAAATVFVFTLSTFAGWLLGYIKIRHAGGSIVPGWIAHALANGATYGWVWLAL